MINKRTLTFLEELRKHNTREWFAEYKKDYENARREFSKLIDISAEELNLTDVIESKKIFRINRDVRFSKNKSPYKHNLSGFFTRASITRRGGYFLSIEPGGKTVVGGGFYAPEKEDLLRIRREFEMDVSEIEKVTSDQNFIRHFGRLRGEALKTAPRDFDKEHPNIKWINMKQFYAFREFTDMEVIDASFPKEVSNTFLAIRPFFDYMSDVLTTNMNGESKLG
jgi:uncharacterized protein (TIGR02453 family)